MASPSVSVLMACYNAEAFVAEAIESVLKQTFADFELIIVDDGSTDATAGIVSRYLAENVILIQQDNRGASTARNLAFRRSKGRFVIFLDADDVISPRHLEVLYARAAECPGCISFSRWDRFIGSPDEATFPDRPTDFDLSGVDWVARDWARARPMTQSGMLLLPRRLLDQHGTWNERLTLLDDFEFFARIVPHSDGVRFAPEARLYYRSGIPNSLSRRRSRTALESAFWSLMWGTDHLLSVEDSHRTRRVCANMLQDFDYTYFPDVPDLRAKVRMRVAELGGATVEPDGPPGFHRLRPWVGWRIARLIQKAAQRTGLNRASRHHQKVELQRE